MLSEYDLHQFSFFRAPANPAPRTNLAPQDDIARWTLWGPEAASALWLNQNLSQETASALVRAFREHGQELSLRPGELRSGDSHQDVCGLSLVLEGGLSSSVRISPDLSVEATRAGAGTLLFMETLLLNFLKSEPGVSVPETTEAYQAVGWRALQRVRLVTLPLDKILALMRRHEDLELYVATQMFIALGALMGSREQHALRETVRQHRAVMCAYDQYAQTKARDPEVTVPVSLPSQLGDPRRWVKLIEEGALLHFLEDEDRLLMTQQAGLYQAGAGVMHTRDFLIARRRLARTGLLMSGRVDISLPSQGRSEVFLAQKHVGAFLGFQQLATPQEREVQGLRPDAPTPMSPLEASLPTNRAFVRLEDASVVLTLDWRALRWLFFRKKHVWQRLCHLLNGSVEDLSVARPELYVFYGAQPHNGATTLAHGAALMTALKMACEDSHDDLERSHVCLVDTQNRGSALDVFFQDGMERVEVDEVVMHRADICDGEADDFNYFTRRVHIEGKRSMLLGQGAEPEPGAPTRFRATLEVTWPEDLDDIDNMVRQFIREGHAKVIIVSVSRADIECESVRYEGSEYSDSRGDNKMVRQLNALSPTVVWVSNEPDLPYDLTCDVPRTIIRADVLTEDFIRRERAHTERVMQRLQNQERCADLEARPTPQRLRHMLRVPWDPEGFHLFTSGDLPAFLRSETPLKRTFERLTRMVRRRTVGVALGGGGAWGFSQIALLRQLNKAGVPIDYISGASFGSLVAGLFAAGGDEALEELLNWSELEPALRSQHRSQRFYQILQNILSSRLTLAATLALIDSDMLRQLTDSIIRDWLGRDAQPVERPGSSDKPSAARSMWPVLLERVRRGLAPGHRDIPLPVVIGLGVLAHRLPEGCDRDAVLAGWLEQLDDFMALRTAAPGEVNYTAQTRAMGETLLPFLPVGTDLDEFHGLGRSYELTLSRSTIGAGMRSASCLPPAYSTMHINGNRIGDGAFVAFVPAGATHRFGADFNIACNVVPVDSELLHGLEFDWFQRLGSWALVQYAARVLLGSSDFGAMRNSLVSRGMDALKGFYMMAWKSGQDQGGAYANYVVDMQPQNFEVFEFWRGREIVSAYEEMLEALNLADTIYQVWRRPCDWLQDGAWYSPLGRQSVEPSPES